MSWRDAVKGQRDSQHRLLANEYWTLRMREDESFATFKRKVQALEVALQYNFNAVPHGRMIEAWLGRLTPKLVERVQARTNDLLDLKSVQDLFDVIKRMEAADGRVARGRQLCATPTCPTTVSTFDYAYQAHNLKAELERFQEQHSGFFRHLGFMQHEVDIVLARIPPHIFFELRRDSRNLKDIDNCHDILKHLSRLGDVVLHGVPELENDEEIDRLRREQDRAKFESEDTEGRKNVRAWKIRGWCDALKPTEPLLKSTPLKSKEYTSRLSAKNASHASARANPKKRRGSPTVAQAPAKRTHLSPGGMAHMAHGTVPRS